VATCWIIENVAVHEENDERIQKKNTGEEETPGVEVPVVVDQHLRHQKIRIIAEI